MKKKSQITFNTKCQQHFFCRNMPSLIRIAETTAIVLNSKEMAGQGRMGAAVLAMTYMNQFNKAGHHNTHTHTHTHTHIYIYIYIYIYINEVTLHVRYTYIQA